MKEEEKKVEKQPTACQLIEDAAYHICLDYCKYADEGRRLEESGEVKDGDEWLEVNYCRDCPVEKLW